MANEPDLSNSLLSQLEAHPLDTVTNALRHPIDTAENVWSATGGKVLSSVNGFFDNHRGVAAITAAGLGGVAAYEISGGSTESAILGGVAGLALEQAGMNPLLAGAAGGLIGGLLGRLGKAMGGFGEGVVEALEGVMILGILAMGVAGLGLSKAFASDAKPSGAHLTEQPAH